VHNLSLSQWRKDTCSIIIIINKEEKMKIFISLLFVISITSAQQGWVKIYGGTQWDEGRSAQQTADGGYIVAGDTRSFGTGGSFDVWLLKTNAFGDTLWSKVYGGTNEDAGFSVQQTADGGYIIAGETYFGGAEDYDVLLIKTDASGTALWTKTYGGSGEDQGYSVQQTTDGGYIVAGFGYPYDFYLIKTNASGDTLWTRTYGGSSIDIGRDVQQTADGGYIVAGYTLSFGSGNTNVYLVKTNAFGDTLWTRAYGGSSGISYWGYSVQQTQDGGYIVAGLTEQGSSYDVYIIKTNASGDTLWTKTYGDGGIYWEEAHSVRQTTDGGYIVAAITQSSGAGGFDVWLIKTNAAGDTLWTRTYGGTNYDFAESVRQTADGGYIIAGETMSFGAGVYDVYLIKTDAQGLIGVEDQPTHKPLSSIAIYPNPFVSFAVVPGHESERFSLYDVSGRKAGTFHGNRIGEGLASGVYFLKPQGRGAAPVRVVKVR
jgi:hypothetical protein